MDLAEGAIVVTEDETDAIDEDEAYIIEEEEEEERPDEGLLMPNWVVYWYWPVASTISWMP